MVIPHPQIPIGALRPTDILLLSLMGASFEALKGTLAHLAKRRSDVEIKMKSELNVLRYETNQKRRLGPLAFVETSKLERAVLAKEKQMAELEAKRTEATERVSRLNWNASIVLNLVVFALYYGMPMLSIDGGGVPVGEVGESVSTEAERASAFMRGMLFPLSYIGPGMRLAGIGLAERPSCVGALVVLWAAQATVGKISECVDALTIR